MSVRLMAPLGAVLALSACVVAPAPFIAVPGYNKDSASFQADEASCRQDASRAAYAGASQSSEPGGAPAIGTRSGNEAAWDRYDQQFAQCMATRGNGVEPQPSEGYGYGSPYGGYGYGYGYGGYGYPYGVAFGYPFGGFYGGVYDGFGLGFGYGGFGRFGYGGYGRFGGYGGFGGYGVVGFFGVGFGHGGGFGGHGGGGGHR